MAELSFKSPGVSVREIDLSGPTRLSPAGIPAGVIGTAVRGPAFVPITIATFQDFVSKFGNTDGEKFGPLAMYEWMQNARAGTYVRVLGVGDGKAKNTTSGKVTNAGFVVGDQLPQGNGNVGTNPKAFAVGTSDHDGLGRAYVLGCFMSESAGSSTFRDAGILNLGDNRSRPIIRGVVMAPSGVLLSLSCSYGNGADAGDPRNNTVSTTVGITGSFTGSAGLAGANFGDVDLSNGKSNFKMLLNGMKISDTADNTIDASFDPKASNYFSKVFNTDPSKLEELGHYLYAHWDIDGKYLTVTSSGNTTAGHGSGGGTSTDNSQEITAFLLTGSAGRNTGNATLPDYEDWQTRFNAAYSPFVISQKFGGKNENLFKLHALDDGAVGGGAYKITIENVQKSSDVNSDYGTFDLLIRKFDDSDEVPKVLESWRGLNLDPSSERYIARIIGDTNTFYDFDKQDGAQKLVIDGMYANASQFVRVELSDKLSNGSLDGTALPVGFRGLNHLVTSGTNSSSGVVPMLTGSIVGDGHLTQASLVGLSGEVCKQVVQLPVPMRETIARGVDPKKTTNSALTWGVQFELKDKLDEPNKHQKIDPSMYGFTKWFPNHRLDTQNVWVGGNEGTETVGGTVLDADVFNNNLFTLERVQVITASNDRPDAHQWQGAQYQRAGKTSSTLTKNDGTTTTKVRFLDPAKDFDHLPTRKYLKFTFPLQGGFDGVNIFNEDKSKFLDAAVRREMDDSSQGAASGPTVAAYRKAISVMEEKSDVDIQLLAIPGIRHTSVTDFAIESVERRFDAMLIMDVEEKDTLDTFVTSSGDQIINVANTVNRLSTRALDSSFAAAYFPDVLVTDPSTGQNVQCPPTVAVLGAFSLNDRLAHPWFAPAGFTRGALASVIESKVKLNRANLDELYSADINPLVAFPHTRGTVVFGQKTLMAAQSALDRVNVRRLLIDVRRKVKSVANSLLFEPNRESTLAAFSAAVTPILNTIQQQQGLDRFKVQIDTSTTTQADVENNTIRGKIFLQPTRAVEFISLDFVVTNAGSGI